MPHLHQYDYVWYNEVDVTFKGNLTAWVEGVHAVDPKVRRAATHAPRHSDDRTRNARAFTRDRVGFIREPRAPSPYPEPLPLTLTLDP